MTYYVRCGSFSSVKRASRYAEPDVLRSGIPYRCGILRRKAEKGKRPFFRHTASGKEYRMKPFPWWTEEQKAFQKEGERIYEDDCGT